MTDSTTPTTAGDGAATSRASRPVLQQRRGHEFTRILAFGAARGENVVPNDDLVGPIDSSDEWIRQRTGIITRKRAGADVEAVDLAEAAAREAIAKAGIEPSQIGVVLVSTVTHTVATPSMASLLAERIGATPAAAYDVSAACAGYAYGIAQADSFIKSGLADHVLVVGAEKLSDVVDPTDRSISFLLGDGAGAAVVGPSDQPGIGPSIWGSDGSKWDAIGMTATYNEWAAGAPRPTMRQAGQTVFRWAVWEMVKVARQAIEAAGSSRATSPRSSRTRPTSGSSTSSPSSSACPSPSSSPATSRRPATPPPRASRSPRTGCSTSTRSCPRPRAPDRLRSRSRVRRAGRRPPLVPAPSGRGRCPCPRLVHGQTTPPSRRTPMALSNEEVLAGLAELINDETGIATDTVAADKSFTDDLDIDSISMMTIVVNAEEKFDVKIPDEEVKNLRPWATQSTTSPRPRPDASFLSAATADTPRSWRSTRSPQRRPSRCLVHTKELVVP